MLSARPKQHRKVRTGCRTCKKRRVKCDESFPACLRCIKLGQVCDGYGIWGGGGARRRDTSISATLESRNGLVGRTANVICRTPTSMPGLCVSSEEQSYLQWFIHGTAASPPRIFNSSFWDPDILRAASQEPMILQVVLALSAAHKRHVLDPINRRREGLEPDAHEIFLLKHYGSAVRGLQGYLNREKKIPRAKLFAAAAMCSMLVLVELMRGRFVEACVHLQSGAHIAELITKEPDQMGISRQLPQFFVRLRDQTMIFRRRASGQRYYSAQLAASPDCKLRFSSPAEAAHYLDDLIEQVAFLAQQSRQMSDAAQTVRVIQQDVCDYLLSCFESWFNAYNSTMTEQRLNLAPEDATMYQALLERYKISVKIAERCVGSGSVVDTQLPI